MSDTTTKTTHIEMCQYLWAGGWFQSNSGWWHPPNCLASWPIDEAFAMAKRDDGRGLRMTAEEAKDYLEGR